MLKQQSTLLEEEDVEVVVIKPIVQVVVVKAEVDVVVVVVEPLPPNVIVLRTHATAGFTASDNIIPSTSAQLYKII